MLPTLPPTKVSSTSTSPVNGSKDLVCIASRTRCSTNHADFWVSPTARPSSWLLTPFFELARSQIEVSHLSSGIGESSKIVPNFTVNCFLQALHFHTRRVVR